ncbi:metal-sulfur cluster assembly factor [Pyrofollis japonicus]|uniref:metal-sulfur cluster assembly factor n=1 Tax=Pyrofollis japonicus TaxID=3060460 RepID=UPI00295B38F0|nr:iron-sulfur cluster assembly protein [Pyrofollis japonicus]BEP17633.1 metal-sulfur cluster assembly factor [Pyrofollis japonicus]
MSKEVAKKKLDPEEVKKKVIEALRNVYDPEIPVNIYDLGLVYDIKIEDGKIKVRLGLTAPGCPVSGQIAFMAEEAIRQAVPEAEDVEIELDLETPWDPRRVTPEGRQQLKELFGYDVVEEWIKRYEEMYGSQEA